MDDVDAALCGHTHIAADETIYGVRVINPGALRYARDGATRYAILDVGTDVYVAHVEYKKGTFILNS